jgi:UDP-N-acetylglucosamine 2-epimerase (non-hydrolysing)/GDP/UDP-N,N'-diacetylbacillosamine 2-epimerase (hydrolysing)
VAVFTGNRAEYGLLYPVLRALAADPRFEYQLVVSGAHLKENFGRTIEEIESDGFEIHARVAIDMPEDSLFGTAQAIGSGVLGLSKALAELRPDLMLVYSDRFEAFAACIAATQMGIPTAHLEAGDYTEGGALDDSVRHAMTKLAHLHLATNEQAAERVRRMGEEPWRVSMVGLPALDRIFGGDYAEADAVRGRFGLDVNRPVLVFTQHAVATEFERAAEQVRPSLEALEEAGRRWNCQIILTAPNDDAGGRRIMEELERFASRGLPFIQLHRSLGRRHYHGVLAIASACVGNSSSGIKETPALHCPTIDIGTRQQGRLRAGNVIQTGYDRAEILAAIDRCLHDEAFRAQVEAGENPYGSGQAGARIAEILATVPLDGHLLRKRMTY